jgi:hypothetical protein
VGLGVEPSARTKARRDAPLRKSDNPPSSLFKLLFHLHPHPDGQDWVYRTPHPCFFILFDQVQFLQLPGRVLTPLRSAHALNIATQSLAVVSLAKPAAGDG